MLEEQKISLNPPKKADKLEKRMSWKSSRGFDSTPKSLISRKLTLLLCIGCFCAGMLFTSRMSEPEEKGLFRRATMEDGRQNLIKEDCDQKAKNGRNGPKSIFGEGSKTHHAVQTLDKTISNLEMELASARATQESMMDGSPVSESTSKRKYLMVVGVNTAFSSRKRRDSVRATWMPQGEKRKKLEEEKGIIMRFVIGHRGRLVQHIGMEWNGYRNHGGMDSNSHTNPILFGSIMEWIQSPLLLFG